MDRRETERLLEAIHQARAAGEPAALATVVRVRGSAYRREGTRMFVRQDRSFECALSGGCLEPDVAEAAARVIESGEPITVSYDLADDSIWGLGIGCSGAVDIRIERIEDDAITREWLRILEQGEAAALVTPLSGAAGRMIVRGNGERVGTVTGAIVEQAAARARARLDAPYPSSAAELIGEAELFFEVATPPPELIVFGGGHDAPPVARLARSVGFSVTIVDARQAFLTAERFPGATLVCAHPSLFAERVALRAGNYVLIMNHHVERDEESLRFSLESPVAYIGVLGPRARYEKLLARLATRGCVPPASRLASVRSPVGLALGAETPPEVAVAIVSELLAVRRGFEGGFLSGSVAGLHRADDVRDQRALATS
jgi:xanthine/CO dehydrogenase XdhC/CoxF family maturation factor